MNIWQAMIALHAVTAVLCFASGAALLSLRFAKKHAWLVWVFVLALAAMILFMLGAMVSHWYDITPLERIVFSGLAVLGMYMLYRSFQAKNTLQKSVVSAEYTDHIGFALIALFNGFIIVALIDIGLSGWMVILVAVAAVVLGGKAIKLAKKRNLGI